MVVSRGIRKRVTLDREIDPVEPHGDSVILMRRFEDAVGGRGELIALLAHAEAEHQEDLLVRMLADPRNDNTSLAKLCALVEITPAKFITFLRKGKGAKALVAAMDSVFAHTPRLAEEAMEYAHPQKSKCAACGATGSKDGAVCTTCWGEGHVTLPPDIERQKVALEIAGLLKSRGGPGVSVQIANQQVVNVAAASLVRTSADFRSATDSLLFGGQKREEVGEFAGEVVDAEEVGDPEAGAPEEPPSTESSQQEVKPDGPSRSDKRE